MKYPANAKNVGAIYDNAAADNPFLAAMPEMMSREAFLDTIKCLPPLPAGLSEMPAEERRQNLSLLSSIFVPMEFMYSCYDQLYRAMTSTYATRTMLEEVQRTCALFKGDSLPAFATQPATGSILGVPGVGKTSTIRHTLSVVPQVIEHTDYMGKPLFCKQVLYLAVECPSDCSVKSLAFNIVAALDRAIGSDYLNQLTALRSAATSAIAVQIKVLCLTHHIGLILIDEIQNAVVTAQKNKQIKPLLKFLVELTNDTCTSTFFIGTPIAEELFCSEEHLMRRTRGMRLIPFDPDGSYRAFLQMLWPYQLTSENAPLTEQLANKLYDCSGGIPAYIIKIFQESQAQALLQGKDCIDSKTIQKAIDILAIKVPRTYAGGTSISEFDAPDTGHIIELPQEETAVTSELPERPLSTVKRQYANKRGRKATPRDDLDLLVGFQNVSNFLGWLKAHALLEDWPC
ncbi:MAG: ATP-binding protein [Roseburia sp.]|nr:ATP-binding protein [Roseburia sp.]